MNDLELRSKLISYQSFLESGDRKTRLSPEERRCLRIANYVLRGEGTLQITQLEISNLEISIKVIKDKESDQGEDESASTSLFSPLWGLFNRVSTIGSMLWRMQLPRAVDTAKAERAVLDLQKRITAYRDEIEEISRQGTEEDQQLAAANFLDKLINDEAVIGYPLLELFKFSARLGAGNCEDLNVLKRRCELTQLDITEILNGWIGCPHTKFLNIIDRISILVKILNYHDQPTLIQLAKKGAQLCPSTLAFNIHKFQIDDPAELVQLARDCLAHERTRKLDSLCHLNVFNNFGIYDERILAEFFVTLFRFTLDTPRLALEAFDPSYFPSVDVRENMVLQIMGDFDDGRWINAWKSTVIKNLDIFDLPLSFRNPFIKKHLLEQTGTVLDYIKSSKIIDESTVSEIKVMLKANLSDLAENDEYFLGYAMDLFQFLDLDLEEKMRILLILARKYPDNLIDELPKFEIEDQVQLYLIADACDETERLKDPSAPLSSLKHILNFFPKKFPLRVVNKQLRYLSDNYNDFSFSTIKTYLRILETFSRRNIGPLLKICTQIEVAKDEDVRNQLYFALLNKTKLLGSIYIWLMFQYRNTDLPTLINTDLIVKTLELTIPSLRTPLYNLLSPFFIELDNKDQAILDEIQDFIDTTKPSKVPTRWYVVQIVKILAWYGIDREILKVFMNETFSHAQNFKSSETGDRVIEMLYNLTIAKSLTNDEKGFILQKIVRESQEKREKRLHKAYPNLLPKEEKLAIMIDKESPAAKRLAETIAKDREAFNKKNKNERDLLEAIESVLILIELNDTRGALEPISLDDRLKDTFSKIVPFHIQDQNETFISRYLATFGQSRIPNGLFIYGGRLNTLEDDDKGVRAFGEFVSSVFNNDFRNLRYNPDRSKHLGKLAYTHPELFEKWKEGDRTTFVELMPDYVMGEKQEFDYVNWILTLIEDGHILVSALQMYYLEGFRQFPDTYTELLQRIKSIDKSYLEREQKNIIEFQALVLSLIGSNKEQAHAILEKLRNLINLDSKLNQMEFKHDVYGMLEPRKATSKNNFIIVDTDNPYDLFYSGTEVTGSCQSITENPKFNCGTLGTLIHGYNRMLKVCETDDGKTTARCLVRLLWNENQAKWVMLMERVYPPDAEYVTIAALTSMAKRRAHAFGVDLVITSAKNTKGRLYGDQIQSFGGSAPYEYSDAAKGICPDGVYTISDANLVVKYREPFIAVTGKK